MKLTILKEKFEEGIDLIGKITLKSLTLPILENFLLETEKNFIKLSATNLESGIIFWSLAKIDEEGKICLPSKIFQNLISFLPNKPLNIKTENLISLIETEKYQTKIKGANPEDFPIIPTKKEGEFLTINISLFCQALNQILNIPSPSIVKPEISGIFLSFQNDLIKFVATDSFRLAEKKIFLKTNLSKEYSLILPQNSAKEIVNIFGQREGDLNIYLSPNQIFIEKMMEEIFHPQIQYTSRLIEGEFPDYQAIIPKKFNTSILIQKEDFLNQIKMASLFSGKINEVKFNIYPKTGKIEISSQNPDLGEYKSEILGKIKGEEVKISFNYKFLIEGILAIKTKEINFELTNEEGPAILKPVGEEDYFYILMPIKSHY